MVDLYLQFRSRRAGSFGSSQIGQMMEWITTTWLRFTCFLSTILMISIAIVSRLPTDQKMLLVVFAPVLSVASWYLFLLALLICRYLGRFGIILAHLLVIFFFIFSRLIVQPPPGIYLPLITGGSRK